MKGIVRRVVLGVAAGVAVYVGFSIWANAGKVGRALAAFHWSAAAIAAALALANYLVRFGRWEYYLRVLGIRIPRGESFLVFMGGFALTVTPGKLGEVVKGFLLRESRGIPLATTAPIVIAERLTDLVGLLLLACVGIFTFEIDRRFVAAGVIAVGLGLLVVSVEPLAKTAIAIAAKLPGFARFAPKLDEFYRSTRVMLRPGPLVGATLLSVVSWSFECLAFWVVVGGFDGASIGLRAGTFIYAAMTIAGALSFLPGGLGVTELGMLTMLGKLGTGIDPSTAAAATFVTRLCTLWFAVALGLVALVVFSRRKHIAVDAAVADKGPK